MLVGLSIRNYTKTKSDSRERSIHSTLLAVGQAFESCLFMKNYYKDCDTETELDITLNDVTLSVETDNATAPTKVCFDLVSDDDSSVKGCYDSESRRAEMGKSCNTTTYQCHTPSG